jgi:hypothetical protein
MLLDERVRSVSRRLRDLVEPIAANVYFAAEAQEAYRELDLDYGAGYFCSRGGCLGQVPGEVVVAAFGVFSPAFVLPSVRRGWEKTDRDTILAARHRGATASLRRILGDEPAGMARATELLRRAADAATGEARPLFSGLRSLGYPGDPIGDLWRAADLVREHRGDSHNAAWVAHDIDATEITLLTELWWRIPLNSYAPTRGWSPEEIEAAAGRLRERGLIDGDTFTAAGEQLRADIEAATDRQERRIVEALGDDGEELFSILEPYADAILAAGGYPADPRTLTRP